MARLAVALSGGVDSSVAAARLVAAGHEVIGLTARLLRPQPAAESQADAPTEAERAAAAVCQRLGIEHHVVDLSEEFAARVLDYFTRAYADGLTPNPCLPCNAFIKFGALLDEAGKLGCEALATGHYALCQRRGDRWGLRRGADEDKDQSYVLMFLTQDQLARARFPLGRSRKAEVVAEARRLGLPVMARASQDLCFVPPGVDYAQWLARRVAVEPGPIIDLSGRELGRHRGLIYY
ncbi:MAG: tRNA 2-thiouridine(34) synthase MnmA, partial [Armatimonadetes bacterium]|nr:tRNA 2-thiouridine(34) synthase MnmA [Armatimonadota bacterium]